MDKCRNSLAEKDSNSAIVLDIKQALFNALQQKL